MCQGLPFLGPVGLCQQLACIAAVQRLANVTHLDMLPKNTLFGARSLGRGEAPRAQVALFDFDISAIGSPDGAIEMTRAREGGLTFPEFEPILKKRLSYFETIGGMADGLLKSTIVGYTECARTNRSFPPVRIKCPFESLLRSMLPQPGVLNERDFASLKAITARSPTKIWGCQEGSSFGEKGPDHSFSSFGKKGPGHKGKGEHHGTQLRRHGDVHGAQ